MIFLSPPFVICEILLGPSAHCGNTRTFCSSQKVASAVPPPVVSLVNGGRIFGCRVTLGFVIPVLDSTRSSCGCLDVPDLVLLILLLSALMVFLLHVSL